MKKLKKTADSGLKTKIVFNFKNSINSLKQLTECLRNKQ